MFTGRAGRTNTIRGGEDSDMDVYVGGSQWESHTVSEASTEVEEEEE